MKKTIVKEKLDVCAEKLIKIFLDNCEFVKLRREQAKGQIVAELEKIINKERR